jgi:exosortase
MELVSVNEKPGFPISGKLFYWLLWIAASILLLFRPELALVHYSLTNDNASHIILIPFLSAYVFYADRDRIFRVLSTSPLWCAILAGLGSLFLGIVLVGGYKYSETNRLTLYTLALAFFWAAGFALLFGKSSLKRAAFPLLFLLFMIPLPDEFLEKVIYFLQKGSADVAQWSFDLFRVPAMRDGFVFHLAHVNIEVAKECSGIRSSLALLILATLVAHFLLVRTWTKFVFVAIGILIMVVKNGIRIATLTMLAQYVDPGFLFGRLHHEGGVVFFLIGLGLLVPVYWLLRRLEKQPARVEL